MKLRTVISAMGAFLCLIAFGPATMAAEPTFLTLSYDDCAKTQLNPNLDDMDVTFFIPTAYLGADPWCMKPADLKKLADAGNEIAAHFTFHVEMDKIVQELLRLNVMMSAGMIKEWAGVWPVSYSPPYCNMDDRVEQVIKIWFKYIVFECGADNGGFNSMTKLDRWIGRLDVTYTMTSAQVCAAVDKAYTSHKWLVLLFHDIVNGKPEEYQVSAKVHAEILACVRKARDDGKIVVKTVRAAAAAIVGKECDCPE